MSRENVETVRRAHRAWESDDLEVEIDEVRDLGNTELLLGRFVVTGQTTRIEFGTELGQIFTFRDGKIASSHDYLRHRAALDAAGLSE